MKDNENLKKILRRINNYFFNYKNEYDQGKPLVMFADIDLLENYFVIFTKENEDILNFHNGILLNTVTNEIYELKAKIYSFLKQEAVDIDRIINLSERILFKIDSIESFLKNYELMKKILL